MVKPEIICIHETKSTIITDIIIDSIWDATVHECLFAPSQGLMGLSGGLLTSWDSTKFTLLNHEINNNWIWARFSRQNDPSNISNYISIYAPQKPCAKTILWRNLQRLVELYSTEAYFILGDFNSIRFEGESTNCTYRAIDTEKLNNFIITNNFWEVPIENYRFTWFGPEQRSSKLDRFVLNQVANIDNHWKVKGLGRKQSDHVCLYLYNYVPLN